MPEQSPMIEAQQVAKIYSRRGQAVSVLQQVSLRVGPGELVVISGVSGSGKTTLLNILGCLDRPSAGKLLFAGIDVNSSTSDELAQLRGERVGFVFQHNHLLRHLSALENVLLPLTLAGCRSETQRARELLGAVGLAHRCQHRPAELSGGEQQRVAIARALVREPFIVLADEPTGNLDQRTGVEILNLITGMVSEKSGRSVVIVTHQPEMILVPARRFEISDGVLFEMDQQLPAGYSSRVMPLRKSLCDSNNIKADTPMTTAHDATILSQ